MATGEPLADGFPPARETDWRTLALHGEKGIEALRWRTLDGIPVGPVYPPFPGERVWRPTDEPWTIVERIAVTDAGGRPVRPDDGDDARCADVELFFIPESASDRLTGRKVDAKIPAWVEFVTDVASRCRTIWVEAGFATPQVIRAAGDSVRLNAICDPLAHVASGHGGDEADTCYVEVAALLRTRQAGIAVTADGRLWHDAGATDVQELAVAVASAVASLRRLAGAGVGMDLVWPRLGVRLAADADQFLTIAKFRAIRLLLGRIGEIAGLDGCPPIHAETSWRMLGAREPTMNLVRATTAAFAAATGGADAITVASPLLDDARFSARMARNVQLILRDESSLARTADPGTGSGAIEDLTERLAAEAWALFTRIEAEGGLPAAIRSGSILEAVAAARDRRLEAVARRAIPLVGVNVNVDPEAPSPMPPAGVEAPRNDRRLRPIRLAEPLERLAALLAQAMGGAPAIVIRTGKGGDPDVVDALAAVGIRATGVGSLAELAAPPRLACIVVGDGGAGPAEDAAAALRAAGARVILAATAGSTVPPAWCDGIVTPDCDLLSVFAGLLDRIADRPEKGHG